jgi:hypothetical protein
MGPRSRGDDQAADGCVVLPPHKIGRLEFTQFTKNKTP